MTLGQIKDILNANILCGDQCLETEINSCFACDLISEMLLYVKPRSLVITSLTNPHIIHTAQVMDASAVIFVAGKKPDPVVIMNGELNGIPLLTTALHIFECCGLLYTNGIRGDGQRLSQ